MPENDNNLDINPDNDANESEENTLPIPE